VDSSDPTKCVPPPADWDCNTFMYGDGYCDCGCGAKDPDCGSDATKADCRCAQNQGSCAPYDCSTLLPNDLTLCTTSAPTDWTCPRKYYHDGACDCGCGVKDYDCANANLSTCKFCNDTGSCSTQKCASNTEINATNNAVCN
jgi:hypothetical protein